MWFLKYHIYTLIFFKNLQAFFFFLEQIETQLQERNQNAITLGEPTQPKEKWRDYAHVRSDLPSDQQIATCHNKTFDTPTWVKFFKDILVSNTWGLFQVRESMFSLNVTIILQTSQMTSCVFSMGHCKELRTRLFLYRHIIHGNPLLRKPNAAKPFWCLT